MPLLPNEIARRENGELHVREAPLRVRWRFADLACSDRHDLRCTFECSVRALPDYSERRMLGEVLLNGKDRAAAEDVAQHFARTLHGTAAGAAARHAAGEWVGGTVNKTMLDALVAAAKPVAFACGVEVMAPFHLELESQSFQRQRIADMQRALAEQQVAGQMQHMQRAGELLRQFEGLRQSAPNLSAGQLLQQLNPTDRGSMLQTLLLATASQASQTSGTRAESLWAVAGPYLIKIDHRAGPSPKTQLFPLPPTLGPLRSVQPADVDGRQVLLVGAQGGFMAVRVDSVERAARPEALEVESYADPALTSQFGFNRVVYWPQREQFAGCHGDGGLVCWSRGKTDAPVSARRPSQFADATAPPTHAAPGAGAAAPGPRNVQLFDDGHLIFSAGHLVWLMGDDSPTALPSHSGADVGAIIPDGPHVLIVHEDGVVCSVDRATRETVCRERRGMRVHAAGPLPWLGGTRLLLAGDEGAIQCVGLDDPLVTQYSSAHRGPRVVAGSAELVAAVSGDRQRVVLWNSWDGRQPIAEVYVAGLARHRVADVDFA